MGQDGKRSYLEQIYERYHKANRATKSKILDEFCEVCGYHRKHALRLLKRRPRRRKLVQKSKPGRKPQYHQDAILTPLKAVWMASDYVCSKKLVVMLPLWLPHYETHYSPLQDNNRQKLLSLSASTIDRLLKPYRAMTRKRFSTTKPGKLLKNQIPIKTHHWDVSKPGFVEADTVAHCGNSLAGDFAWSLTLTDIKSTWTENRAVWNKGADNILKAIKDIENRLPFPLLGFDCDNGTEFLNYHLIRYFSDRPKERMIQFTRSRPYHKDDNAHVEQKNWTHVRQLFGYDRINNKTLISKMNDLYSNEWCLYQNYFCPTMKLIKKEKINSKYKRYYDVPKTPYQRLLDDDSIPKDKKQELIAIYNSLNPFSLKEQIENKLKTIFKYVRVTPNVRQRI